MKKYLLLVLALMFILGCGGVRAPGRQPSTGPSVPALAFDIAPYEVREEKSSQAGYKIVWVSMLVENVGTNWGFFKSIEQPQLQTQEGYSASGSVNGGVGALPPGVRSIGSSRGLLALRFQIGETLHPSAVELKFIYQPLDKYGNAGSPWHTSDTVHLDLQKLSQPTGMPFARKVTISSLPVSYEMPKGTMRVLAAKVDTSSPRDLKVLVDIEFESSDPAQSNYAGIHATVLTADGIIGDGQMVKGTMRVWGAGPLQTLKDTIHYYFPEKIPLNSPVYLMIYSVDSGSDIQVVDQIIQISQ